MTAPADARRLEYVPLDDLQPADRNPKRHDLPAIGRSIDTFGYVEPVVVDERTGRLVAGHGRVEQLRAARDGGGRAPDGVTDDWRVPVLRGWASVDDTHAAAYLAASNRLVELGGWDEAELGALLADVTAVDAALAGVAGFDAAELAKLLAAAQGTPEARTDPDDAPAVPAEPVSQVGDVWLLGPHRLVCGDSTDDVVIKTLLRDELAACVWTDPPYGVAYQADLSPEEARRLNRRTDGLEVSNDTLSEDGLRDFLAGAFDAALAVCEPGACWYVAAPSGPQFADFGIVLRDRGLWRQTLVWVKDVFAFGRSDYHYRHESIFYGWKPGAAHQAVPDRGQDTVWEIPRPKRSPEHPTMKPVTLITRALDNSTIPSGIVLDPFGGSGSTLIACHTTHRVARLVELDPAYCDVICHRYQAHTGTLPVLERTGATHDFTQAD